MADDPSKHVDGNDGANGDGAGENTDWKAKYEEMRQHSRDWEKKAKANESAADELEKLKAQNLSEQEKTVARAEKAEAELKKLRADAERAQVMAKVASKTKLPLEVVQTLSGEDEDALTAQANSLKKLLPNYPTREDDGGSAGGAKKTKADKFMESLFG